MMHMRIRQLAMVAGLVASGILSQGCAYMHARGRDAKDMLDIGITVTPRLKPDFALYFDFFNVLPLGYGRIDGINLGLGNGQIGALDFTYHNWGVLAVGAERKGSGQFNPDDPRQARPDQADLTERPRFDVGFVNAFKGEEPPPKMQFLECDRALHLGWIGIHATIRPVDIIDFILGWTTLDIVGDDQRD